MRYRVAFDVSTVPEARDQINPALNTVARFLNMHAQAGVPPGQFDAAVVVHGPAGWDLVVGDAYRERVGVNNPTWPYSRS